jgi:YcxB-like protein
MSDTPLVSILVQLAPREFYWTAVRSTTQQLRKTLILFSFIGFLSVSGLIFATLFSVSIKEWQQTIRGTHLPLFAFVGILPIMVIFLAPLFSLAKFLANPGNAAGARIRFSESGVETASTVGKTDWDWTIYQKAQETLNYFLLYPSNYDAQIVPKRCLSTSGEIEFLRDLFRRHIARNNLKSPVIVR